MLSKQVTDSGKIAQRVASATAEPQRNAKAMQGLIARCVDVLPPETVALTVEEAQHFLGLQIEHEIRAAYDRDEVDGKDAHDARELRSERDEAVLEIQEVLLRTRRAYEAIHGAETAGRIGLGGTISRDPIALFRNARICLGCLRQIAEEREEGGGSGELPGFAFDARPLAQALEGPVARLEETLQEVSQDDRFYVDNQADKHAARARLDELVGRAARWLEALYDLAEMTYESDRLRRSTHRPPTTPPEPPSEETEPPDPSTEPVPARGTTPQETASNDDTPPEQEQEPVTPAAATPADAA